MRSQILSLGYYLYICYKCYTILQLNPRVSESLELKSKMSPIPAPTHIWDLPGDRILLIIIINTNYFHHLGRSQICAGACFSSDHVLLVLGLHDIAFILFSHKVDQKQKYILIKCLELDFIFTLYFQ